MSETGLVAAIDQEAVRIVLISREEADDKGRYITLEPLPDTHVQKFGIKLTDTSSFDDRRVFCEECNAFYSYSCREHPLYYCRDRPLAEKSLLRDRAVETLPAFLQIKHSQIPNAGKGVFTTVTLPIGLVFGPYEGVIREKPPQKENGEEDGYTWELRRPREGPLYIDAADPRYSNWMRFVNSPRFDAEQNLVAFQFCGAVFYGVFKEVKVNQELLVWYGDRFGKELGIFKCNSKPKPMAKNPFIFD
ncbi:SET domain containing protein [Aphelenchoides avenae]|nr:SET domain containing protein [Aphelenchus avenae]